MMTIGQAGTFAAPKKSDFNESAPLHATPSASVLEKWLANGKYRYEDGELHKRCSRCKDYWPADTEFFYSAKGDRCKDGLNEWCKACYVAWRWPNGRKKGHES